MKKNNFLRRFKKTKTDSKKYSLIYFYDESGDNIPDIVDAMKKIDTTKAPKFNISYIK